MFDMINSRIVYEAVVTLCNGVRSKPTIGYSY